MFNTELSPEIQERLGPSVSLAQDSFKAQHPGLDWFRDCPAAERQIRVNAWSLARLLRPDRIMDSEISAYEAGLRAAARAGNLKSLDANVATKMGEFAKASRTAFLKATDSTPNVGAQGIQGPPGAPGAKGDPGAPGKDGTSVTVTGTVPTAA